MTTDYIPTFNVVKAKEATEEKVDTEEVTKEIINKQQTN